MIQDVLAKLEENGFTEVEDLADTDDFTEEVLNSFGLPPKAAKKLGSALRALGNTNFSAARFRGSQGTKNQPRSPQQISAESFSMRVLDAKNENCDMLSPISGMKHIPILTLLVTIQSLVGIVEDIERFAKFAMEFAGQMSEDSRAGVSLDDAASINLYTMGEPFLVLLFASMNPSLIETWNRLACSIVKPLPRSKREPAGGRPWKIGSLLWLLKADDDCPLALAAVHWLRLAWCKSRSNSSISERKEAVLVVFLQLHARHEGPGERHVPRKGWRAHSLSYRQLHPRG
jgi:hypothetical protein